MNVIYNKALIYISPLQGFLFYIYFFTTNIIAALPLENAAEQQNICSQQCSNVVLSCRAAKY